MRHKTGFFLLLIGGIIMIISSTTGTIGVFESLRDIAINQWPENTEIFNIVFNIFQWVAELGGIAVIIGAFLIVLGSGKVRWFMIRLGKFIIWIGLAFGTIALIVWILAQIHSVTGWLTGIEDYLIAVYNQFNYGTGLSFIGVTIAIIGRAFVRTKRPKEVKEEEKEEFEEIEIEQREEIDSTKPLEKKFCPSCGIELPVYANFCSNCGETFD